MPDCPEYRATGRTRRRFGILRQIEIAGPGYRRSHAGMTEWRESQWWLTVAAFGIPVGRHAALRAAAGI